MLYGHNSNHIQALVHMTDVIYCMVTCPLFATGKADTHALHHITL